MNIIEEAKKFALSEIGKYGLPIPIHLEISEKNHSNWLKSLGRMKRLLLSERFWLT